MYNDKANGVQLLAGGILAIGKDDVGEQGIPDDSDNSSKEDED